MHNATFVLRKPPAEGLHFFIVIPSVNTVYNKSFHAKSE